MKNIVTFIILMLITNLLFAGGYKWIPSTDPNDPNKPSTWVYQYDLNGETITVKNPVSITQWQYHVLKEKEQVVIIHHAAPVAEKISEKRWISTKGTQVTWWTFEDYLPKEFFPHWLDPNYPGGGYTLHDFNIFAQNYVPKIIIVPIKVYNRPTSKIAHLTTCRYMIGVNPSDPNSGVLGNTIPEAISKGLRPCTVCKPYILPTVPVDPNTTSVAPVTYPVIITTPQLATNEPNIAIVGENTLSTLPKVYYKTGDDFYHKEGEDCSKGTTQTDIIDAIMRNLQPCPICKPNEDMSSEN